METHIAQKVSSKWHHTLCVLPLLKVRTRYHLIWSHRIDTPCFALLCFCSNYIHIYANCYVIIIALNIVLQCNAFSPLLFLCTLQLLSLLLINSFLRAQFLSLPCRKNKLSTRLIWDKNDKLYFYTKFSII